MFYKGAIQARPQMIQNNLAAPPPTLQTQQAKQMLLNSGINPLSLAQQVIPGIFIWII